MDMGKLMGLAASDYEPKDRELREDEKKMFGHTPESVRNHMGGVQYKFKFKNGYGASVVRHSGSYGSENGLWELAVLGADGGLNYDTPITDDVEGHLSDDDVEELLNKIDSLDGD